MKFLKHRLLFLLHVKKNPDFVNIVHIVQSHLQSRWCYFRPLINLHFVH